MRIVLVLGPQGAGKGTQSQLLGERMGMPAFSMGKLLRDAVQRDDAEAAMIRDIQLRGALVPEELALRILARRTAQPDAAQGYILDGFPRDVPQLHAFDAVATITDVLVLQIPEEESFARLLRRAEIEQRADDTPEVIRLRLEVYRRDTLPVLAELKSRGIVREVDGMGSVEEVAARVAAAME